MLLGSALACTLAALALLVAPLISDALPVLGVSCLAGVLLLAARASRRRCVHDSARAGETQPRSWPQPCPGHWRRPPGRCDHPRRLARPMMAPEGLLLAVGGAMLVLAFPVLVLERSCAAIPAAALAEAAGLAALLRAVLLVQIALGTGAHATRRWLCRRDLAGFSVRRRWSCCWPRSSCCVASPPCSCRRLSHVRRRPAWWPPVSDLHPLRPASVNQAVTRHWGIDLSRSWALGFVGRAVLPIGLLLAVLAWGLTGLVALPLDQRAVYERFGRPVAVVGPGLHLLLPWPLGVSRRVELGVLHELTLRAGTGRLSPEPRRRCRGAAAADGRPTLGPAASR